jgi:nucleotide-binding universal stress UspA family protein
MTTSDATVHHRIVAGIDGSESSLDALQWAARQAQLTGSTLEVITTWDWPVDVGWSVPLPEDYDPAAGAQDVLDHALEPIRKAYPDVDIQPRPVEGHPAPALVEASQEADLLVIGSRGRGKFAGMLLGSVSQYCVTNAHCAVTVVRDKP